jgi:hypothetical protein
MILSKLLITEDGLKLSYKLSEYEKINGHQRDSNQEIDKLTDKINSILNNFIGINVFLSGISCSIKKKTNTKTYNLAYSYPLTLTNDIDIIQSVIVILNENENNDFYVQINEAFEKLQTEVSNIIN